ncbi:LytR/AlgR family response regulator transcription factor [Ornithinibacillus scapharcae]|uniref:LytR/AlgR family response regulator transcription factor n=1 Tax=Ornithinibacillus scapharcae TaxID=1147159 RepID=UPI00031B04E9|nr:response regulator [Ornithinibacillus scapharcae]
MKAILVDDEPLALDFLEIQLKRVSKISIEGKYSCFNLEENKELIKQVDIAFLDIDMPNVKGIELAAEMLHINPDLLIIFVTAYNDYATEAFELTAFDYLIKPIHLDRLRKTCERINSTLSSNITSPEAMDKDFMIQVGGELTFKLSDGTIIRPEWRTFKVKELFLYLLHERGRSIL